MVLITPVPIIIQLLSSRSNLSAFTTLHTTRRLMVVSASHWSQNISGTLRNV